MAGGLRQVLIATACVAVVLASVAPGIAEAESVRGSYIRQLATPAQLQPAPELGGGPARVLFLNRCVGGCVVTPGANSSANDTSSIVSATTNLSAFSHGDAAWNQVVSCTHGIFAPFNIEVTDVEPTEAHHEVMIAGTDQEFGLTQSALGISPLVCSVIPQSLTFVFANTTLDLDSICAVAAQEPAHSWGLDHELVCEDPMTYLTGCGPKTAFQDVIADCGEFTPRACACGGTTQNSHIEIAGIFGLKGAPGPDIVIASPADGERVESGFAIELEISGDAQISSASVTVDGLPAVATGATSFRAPESIDNAVVVVEATAIDIHGGLGMESIMVMVGVVGGGSVTTTTGAPPGEPRGGCSSAPTGTAGGLVLLLIVGAIVRPWRRRKMPVSSAS